MILQSDWPSIKEDDVIYAVSLSNNHISSGFIKVRVVKATRNQIIAFGVTGYLVGYKYHLRSDYYVFDNYAEAAEFYCREKLEKDICSLKRAMQQKRDLQHQYLHKLKDLK